MARLGAILAAIVRINDFALANRRIEDGRSVSLLAGPELSLKALALVTI
jgi:hypothetical protein